MMALTTNHAEVVVVGSREEWWNQGRRLGQEASRVQFAIGDWLRAGERNGFIGKYTDPKVYAELEEVTRLKRQTLKNIRSVSENVPLTVRCSDLSFAHHAEVASLSEAEQTKFLRIAAEQDLSVKDLRKKIGITDHEVMRDINRRLDERKELNRALSKDEIQHLETRTKDLLSEINSLPLIFRIKIKQGISRKV